MSLKKLGLALLAVLALGAVAANSAMAVVTTGVTSWYMEGVKATGALPITCAQSGEFTFETVITATVVKWKASGTECVESKIENVTNGEGAMALFSGKLKFTGVTLLEPLNCNAGATITTKALWGQQYMDGEHSDLRLFPVAGEETAFMSFELVGPACPFSGVIVIPKGTVFAREEKLTGESAVAQNLSFSGAINAGAGGTLHVGPEPAVFTGSIGLSLGAPDVGKKFKSE